MIEERMSGSDVAQGQETDALEILMSILMLSAQKPLGITKDEILTLLATYGQTALYELCADQEMQDDEDEDEDEEASATPVTPNDPVGE